MNQLISTALQVKAHIPQGIKSLDELLDYVPIGSSVSNVVGIGLKHLVFKKDQANEGILKDYAQHIQQKEDHLFFVYSLPVIGNVSKLGKSVYEFIKTKYEKIEDKVQENGDQESELEKKEPASILDYIDKYDGSQGEENQSLSNIEQGSITI